MQNATCKKIHEFKKGNEQRGTQLHLSKETDMNIAFIVFHRYGIKLT